RQRRKQRVGHYLQAARAARVQRVLGRVPGVVIEIDDVHRRDAGGDERQMVVLDARRIVDEIVVELQPLGGVHRMLVSHGVELVSRRIARSRSPIMSTSSIALMVASEPSWRARST